MSVAETPISLNEQQHIVLDDVPWEFYEHLLRVVGDRPIRITYHRGYIEIMSPLPKHEIWKKRIGRLLELMSAVLEVDIEPFGSTTFREEAKASGLEPDECYYVQHAKDVRGLYEGEESFDLTRDPPPDLAVEIDITSRSIDREPIYAALGVPELWRFNGRRLMVLELTSDGKYRERDSSIAFPFLPLPAFCQFLRRISEGQSPAVIREFQQWVRTLQR